MNLYLVRQYENNGYDAYDSMIVVAPDKATAKRMHPCDHIFWNEEVQAFGSAWPIDGLFHAEGYGTTWATKLNKINVQLLGTYSGNITTPTVILAR